MSPLLQLKAFDHTIAHSGVRQIDKAPNCPLHYLIFCDAVVEEIDLPQPAKKQHAITLVEQSIREKLSKLSANDVNENAFKLALQYANQQLINFVDIENYPILISALIVAVYSNANDSKDASEEGVSLYLAGAGDCRVYAIDEEGVSLAFYDPKNQFRSSYISPERRYQTLENVLGNKSYLNVQCRRIYKDSSQSYLIASCGVYQQAVESDLHALGMHPNDPQKGASPYFSRCRKENDLLLTICQIEKQSAKSSIDSSEQKGAKDALAPQRKKGGKVVLTLSALALAGLSTVWALNRMPENNSEPSQAILSLQENSRLQNDVILKLKKEIDEKAEELRQIKGQLTQMQPGIYTEALDKAAETIEKLHQLLKEKEAKAKQLTQEIEKDPVLSHTEPSESNGGKKIEKSGHVLLGDSLKRQLNELSMSLKEDKTLAAIPKLVQSIRKGMAQKESELSSLVDKKNQLVAESEALRETIIELQKATLNTLKRTRTQLLQEFSSKN